MENFPEKVVSDTESFFSLDFSPECLSELSGHGAVEDEVDHAVDQGHHVHHLPEWSVAVQEELLSQGSRQYTHNTL